MVLTRHVSNLPPSQEGSFSATHPSPPDPEKPSKHPSFDFAPTRPTWDIYYPRGGWLALLAAVALAHHVFHFCSHSP